MRIKFHFMLTATTMLALSTISEADSIIPKYPDYFLGKNGWVIAKQDYADLYKMKDIKWFWYQIHFDMVKRITAGLEKRGIAVVVVPVPHRTNVYPQMLPDELYKEYTTGESSYPLILKELQSRKINYADILTPLKNSPRYNTAEGTYYRLEPHWNTYGATIASAATKTALKKIYDLSKLPKVAFKLSFGAPKIREDTFWRNNLPESQRAGVKPDIETPYTLKGGPAAGGLLSDNIPAVTIVGTSFTGYGFIAGLKAELGTDILDQSLPGKGMWTPMVDYLKGDNFKKSPPKVLIWEVPETVLSNYPMPTDEDKIVIDSLFPEDK